MNHLFYKTNLTLIQKISFAAVFMALATILQKVLAVNYIPAIPFLRISFGGPAIIIFASILLGPFFGLLVGAGSDLLGYLVFDPKSTGGYFFQITLIYALLGFVSYFVFCLLRKWANKLMLFFQILFMAIILILLSIYLIFNNSFMGVYTIETWMKIAFPTILLTLFIMLLVTLFLINKCRYFQNNLTNVFNLSFTFFIIELLVFLIFGSFMKAWAFGFNLYGAILICQAMVGFFNIILNTILISLLLKISKKYF